MFVQKVTSTGLKGSIIIHEAVETLCTDVSLSLSLSLSLSFFLSLQPSFGFSDQQPLLKTVLAKQNLDACPKSHTYGPKCFMIIQEEAAAQHCSKLSPFLQVDSSAWVFPITA